MTHVTDLAEVLFFGGSPILFWGLLYQEATRAYTHQFGIVPWSTVVLDELSLLYCRRLQIFPH